MLLFMTTSGEFLFMTTGTWVCFVEGRVFVEGTVSMLKFGFCRKLFEVLSFSGALAELTWPTILNKRQLFRYMLFF